MTPSVHERLAVIEAALPLMKEAIILFRNKQEAQEATLNTICVNIATLSQNVGELMRERTIWKNPLVYISALSVGTAIIALLQK